MLLTALESVSPGMTIAAAVLHPRRPEMELLAAGAVVDAPMLARLRQLGVGELWIHHDALADLDHVLAPKLTILRQQVYCKIKEDFTQAARETVSTTQVLAYRQTIQQLVFELLGNLQVAGLTDLLFTGGQEGLFSHGANVAYLATLIGLEMQTYIVAERKRLAANHARDVTALGLGAMLHDVGKTALPPERRNLSLMEWDDPRRGGQGGDQDDPQAAQSRREYRHHVIAGYRMLSGSHAPASAKQVVLNHHQRFDGQGWPDLALTSRVRRGGTQRGRDIHIFCRIVAAADMIDHLLRDGRGRQRPVVAALHDFQSDRFDGWFDPVLRQALLRKLPPFAVGTAVTLSDGRQGAVIAPCLPQPCRPTVRILADARGQAPDGAPPTVVLEQHPELSITHASGVEVTRWLYTLPDLRRAKAG